jgi:DNA-binding LacI/PurR family transcriptional regulator
MVLKQELPRARFGVIPEISDLMLDFGDFARESVSFMKSKNVHKIVYLRTLLSEREGADDLEAIKEVASSQNVEVLQMEEEALTSDRIQKIAYEKIASLIDACRSGETEMPGALLISDDIAAKGAIRALREKSADTEKILLAVMTNSGIEHDYGRPVVKYEFSTREIAEILIGILRKKMLEAAPAESPIKIKGKIKAGGSL